MTTLSRRGKEGATQYDDQCRPTAEVTKFEQEKTEGTEFPPSVIVVGLRPSSLCPLFTPVQIVQTIRST